VRIVKMLCTGKIDAVLLLRAFENGADAVYVAGCASGDCHFLEGNHQAIRTVAHAKRLLAEVGVEPERLEFFHVPASAGPLFAQRANEMAARAKQLGPNPLRSAARQPAGGKLPREADAHPPLPPASLGRLVRDADRATGGPTDSAPGVPA
jgi:coenzyme F420-reducing hydrogenase delta subunit